MRGVVSKPVYGSFFCSRSATKAAASSFAGRQFSAVALDDPATDPLTVATPPANAAPRPMASKTLMMDKKLFTFHPGLSNQCSIIDNPIFTPHMTTRLFVHHIPPNTIDEVGIVKLIVSVTNIHPLAVEQIDYSKPFGWTYVDFRSKQHADLAFESLLGRVDVDKSDRPQKRVTVAKNGDFIQIRKNTRRNKDETFSAPGTTIE
jgi:hypothetical protein